MPIRNDVAAVGPSADVAPAARRPVFIVGCQRSGSTLLGSILGGHSSIVCLPEAQFIVDVMPGLDPEESGLVFMLQAVGISYPAFIQRLVHLALERSKSHPAPGKVAVTQTFKQAAHPLQNFSNSAAPGNLISLSQTLVPVRQRSGKHRRSRPNGSKDRDVGR